MALVEQLSCHFSANGAFFLFFPKKVLKHFLLRVRLFVWLSLSS